MSQITLHPKLPSVALVFFLSNYSQNPSEINSIATTAVAPCVFNTLPAMIALSAVQSYAWILIHNAVLFINASRMLGITKVIG